MMNGMERWKGRVAMVTGASSGIGWAVATRLAEAGMRVAAVARRAERLSALAADTAPAEILPLPTDVRDADALLATFDAVRARWGGVDVMVNNAGLGHFAPLVSGSTQAWRSMLEVNVLALCICTREAITDMRRQGIAGHVIHLSSMAAHRVSTGSGVYSASKFAVRSLTEGLRQELRTLDSDIRVTAISPGFVETEFAEHFHDSADKAREIYSQFPVLQGEDVAESVLYALSQPPHVQVHDILMRPTRQSS